MNLGQDRPIADEPISLYHYVPLPALYLRTPGPQERFENDPDLRRRPPTTAGLGPSPLPGNFQRRPDRDAAEKHVQSPDHSFQWPVVMAGFEPPMPAPSSRSTSRRPRPMSAVGPFEFGSLVR